MTLTLVYWIALGVGIGFLALSLLLGDLFDFLDIEIGGDEFSAAPVFFAAVGAFGAGGLIGTQVGMGTVGSIATGLGTGAAAGFLTALLFMALRRQEAKEGFELPKLVGERGRLSLAVGPGRVGRVTISFAGMTRALTATSTDEIPAGEEVIVEDVVGNSLKVRRIASEQKGSSRQSDKEGLE